MKAAISLILSAFVVCNVNAQWNPPAVTTGDIYYNNGNVGIGTATPSSKLHVAGDVRSTQKFVITGIGALDQQNGDVLLFANQKLLLGAGDGTTPHLTILQNGNIGIGKQNPTAKLEVAGDVRTGNKFIITNVGAFDQQSGNVLISANQQLLLVAGGGTTPTLAVLPNGNVGVGTTTPDSRLTVQGNVHSREVKVTITAGSDFVFQENYELMSLEELEKFIKKKQHLPDIAPAKEMETNGIELGKMDMKLLQKVEELTLYLIELKKEIDSIKSENQIIKERLAAYDVKEDN